MIFSTPKLEVVGILDRGVPNFERVLFRVKEPFELSLALVVASSIAPGAPDRVANGWHQSFWFPHAQLQQGDEVVLYTRNGERSISQGEKGKTYTFFWGMPNTLWNNPALDCAVVFEVDTWQTALPK